MEATVEFTDTEIAMLRVLSGVYLKGGKDVGFSVFKECGGIELNEDLLHNTIARFGNLGFLRTTSTSSFEIQPDVVEVVHKLDNPPLRNIPAEKLAWFNAQPWSWIVVLFITVVSFFGGLAGLVLAVIEIMKAVSK